MKRLYLPLILFIFVILEGVAIKLLPPNFVMSDLLIIPHWVFVFLLFMAIFYDNSQTYFSVLYGALFGMLIDIVYTGVLGVYMFSYAFVIYVVHGIVKMLHGNILVTIILGIVGISLTDFIIYLIFSVVGLTDMLIDDYMLYRLLPTVIANLLFLLVLYPFTKNRLLKWQDEQISVNR
ncbi:rod shape-determining protein MreD [Virgibacillus flavescens]|uniref:rod shape-determining protein MreD n=1 Tax=Virgibacillus flavescens TaxID=1611422 RepID=UPI003D3413A4